MKKTALILLAFALVLPVLGCSSSRATGTAPSDGFPAPDKEFVWTVAANTLMKEGLSPSREDSSKQTWTIMTHWDIQLQPFSGTGFRQRAMVTIHEVAGRPGYYHTQTQVVRQPNNNISEPHNIIRAEWGNEQRVTDLEEMINRRIEMHFLPGAVSPEFRRRYGMGETDPHRIGSDQLPPPTR